MKRYKTISHLLAKRGYHVLPTDGHQKELTPLLGAALSQREQQLYNLIEIHELEAPNAEELARNLRPTPGRSRTPVTIHALIHRIKDKLGTSAIITIRKEGVLEKGYITRRSAIEKLGEFLKE